MNEVSTKFEFSGGYLAVCLRWNGEARDMWQHPERGAHRVKGGLTDAKGCALTRGCVCVLEFISP